MTILFERKGRSHAGFVDGKLCIRGNEVVLNEQSAYVDNPYFDVLLGM
jgi:hypothetical protein